MALIYMVRMFNLFSSSNRRFPKSTMWKYVFFGAQNSFVGLVSGSFLSGSGARSAPQVLVEMASISTHIVRCALICATYLVGCASPNVCIPEWLFFFSQVSAASTAAMALTDSDADAPLSDSGGFLVIHS